MQALAPELTPAFVIDPAAHAKQSVAPAVSTYVPGSHTAHASTFDRVEYVPALHAVHVVAAFASPVFVMDPAEQLAQDVMGDMENFPGRHGMHDRAPAALRVSVVEPDAQLLQQPWAEASWYIPGEQSVQFHQPVAFD